MAINVVAHIVGDSFEKFCTPEKWREVFEAILTATVAAATQATKTDLEAKIDELSQQLRVLQKPTPITRYEPISIRADVCCNETLDLVKSLPEFSGDASRYVSWRQAVFAAHTVFESYTGSSKYYQAVAIIRNKVVGSADSVLSSFNTVLNFDAIIARLDFTYSEKRPVHVLEQQMSLLRQGSLSLNEFYDEVEKKLSAIINKVIMTSNNNRDLASSLCEKYRGDALRIFVSGLRRPMCDILFASRPSDLPSALALAQELECNRARLNMVSPNITPFPNVFSPVYKYNNQSHNRQNKQINQDPFQQPMEVDPSLSRLYKNSNSRNQVRDQHKLQIPFSNSHRRNQVSVQHKRQQGPTANFDNRNQACGSKRFPTNQRINYVREDQLPSQSANMDDQEPIENLEVLLREQNSDSDTFFGESPSYHM